MSPQEIGDALMIAGLCIDLVGFMILFRIRGRWPGYLSIEDYEREQERIGRLDDRIKQLTTWGFGLVVFGLVLQVAGAAIGAA